MKLITWNVNGLRACMKKGFEDSYNKLNSDIFCIQETKMQEDQIDLYIKSISENEYWNSAKRKGYSGTAIFSKIKPLNFYKGNEDKIAINNNIELIKNDEEGRIIRLEFENFNLVNCYVPNSKRELERLEYRMKWEDNIKKYLTEIDKEKPVIYCGDLNVAHKEIDLKNPNSNHHNAGFTDEERDKLTNLLNSGFIDSFRYKYPNKKDEYSWWSYMFHARENNAGWRIDYFLVSDKLKEKIEDCKIHQEIFGSDHCPVELDIDL